MKKLLFLFLIPFLAISQTGTQVKSQIDTDITNKVGTGSISKVNVGTNMKATVDYTDREITTVNTTLSGKENASNKSIDGTLASNSDVKFPSEKAVKTYVDNSVSLSESWVNKSTNVATDGASDLKYPTVKAVKTYVDANIGSGGVLYYANRFYQAGTGAPVGQNIYSGTLLVGNYTMGDNYRDFKVTRASVGLYYFDIIYKSIPTTVNKIMLMCGSGQCRVIGTLSGVVSGENYIRWVIETRDDTGALADDQMNGSTPITITYYP